MRSCACEDAEIHAEMAAAAEMRRCGNAKIWMRKCGCGAADAEKLFRCGCGCGDAVAEMRLRMRRC